MKQNRFRGQRLKDGKWVYGNYVKMLVGVNGDEKIYEHYIVKNIVKTSINNTPDSKPTYLAYYKVNSKTVGQYIGKNDKNNKEIKEIYEGDIVKYVERIGWHGRTVETIGVIEYISDNYNAGFKPIKKDDTILRFYDEMGINFAWSDLEVIGNVCENPELLEGDD